MKDVTNSVKEYYGETLQKSEDLKTNACCTDATLPVHIKKALSNVHDEVLSRYYGCGLIAPEALEGCHILDLGSGSGRDAYVLAQLVGESGRIVGVDMTPEQLAVARSYEKWHRERFGYSQSNVTFLEGELEKLLDLGLDEQSFDVIVSNCVINLCKDKEAVLRAAKRLLKPGGEIYFSDVYADRRVPQALRDDPVLYGECLSGALYINDFESLVKKVGFNDPRIMDSRPITIENAEIENTVGDIRFYSVTYRLFNIEKLEDNCEDYGQTVKYKGSLETTPNAFALDNHHTIKKGEIFPLCGNSYRMLYESRFVSHFEFRGDFSTHYGVFADCGAVSVFDSAISSGCCGTAEQESSSCCAPAEELSSPGMIETRHLDELWFHLGTNCNLSCEGCLEGAGPNIHRVEAITLDEAKYFIDEALSLGVKRISFTGGEPFINPELIPILQYTLERVPVMVLTNGTLPMQKKIEELVKLKELPYELTFRVSLDHSSGEAHDAIRGKGMFDFALRGIKLLEGNGFHVSIARHNEPNEDSSAVIAEYKKVLEERGIDGEKHFVAFPDFLTPGAHPEGIPRITEQCLSVYGEKTGFMCENSRMIVKKGGVASVYACTLVDDDSTYNLGKTIQESLDTKVHLTHHRCFSCYKSGASCSEL